MKVFEIAKRWCEKNPKWKRICDIPDSDALMISFSGLPMRDRVPWVDRFGDGAENAWQEFSSFRPCKYRYGFIGEDSQFYDCITHLPKLMSSMMVFQVGGKSGVYYSGGMRTKTSRAKR